ncbi:MAG: hypothetical protein U9R02_15130 [Thermodesulfobacteriota bacterium]|nr:hypothetical protein [Thermodesulfobacteriota bacterium]
MLGIGDYQLHESIAVCFGWKSPPVIMAFNILVNFRSTLGYRQAKKDTFMYNSGQSFISYQPEWQGLAQYPAKTPVRTVVIFIDPLLLNTFMEGQHDHIPNGMRDIVNGADDKFYYQQSIMIPSVNMGSAKNKFAISGVEALGWQGAKKHEYQAYSEFSQRSQAGCIGA